MSERVKTNGGGGGRGRRRWEGREARKKKGEGANHAPANPFSGAARVHLIASLSN